VPDADSKERLMEERGGYLWFDGVCVFAEDMRLMCVVGGRVVPLPVVILHPDCTLASPGDVGRLGVPRRWAEQQGLCPRTDTNAAGSATDARSVAEGFKPPAPPSSTRPFPEGV